MSVDVPPSQTAESYRKTLSHAQISSYRTAAYLFFAQVVLGMLPSFLWKVPIPFPELAIYLFAGIFIYWLSPSTRGVIIGIAVVIILLKLLLFFSKQEPLKIVVLSLPAWGIATSLLVLMFGTPTRARRFAAICVFGVFNAAFLILANVYHIVG
ncbi:MAG TPA: hypothetical protein VJA66_10635 [Thermoanaerobaculia bacterium]